MERRELRATVVQVPRRSRPCGAEKVLLHRVGFELLWRSSARCRAPDSSTPVPHTQGSFPGSDYHTAAGRRRLTVRSRQRRSLGFPPTAGRRRSISFDRFRIIFDRFSWLTSCRGLWEQGMVKGYKLIEWLERRRYNCDMRFITSHPYVLIPYSHDPRQEELKGAIWFLWLHYNS